MARLEDHRQERLVCLILLLGTFFLYCPVIGYDFITYDDPQYILSNPHVRNGLRLAGVSWATTTLYFSSWHPLTWISHMLDCQLYGVQHPGGHHLTNLLFHAVNAALLFMVLRRLTGALWRSAMVAALFAWHPFRVESVAWVSDRKDVLSGFFWLLTLWAYVRYVNESKLQSPKSKVWYGVTLFCLGLGLMSKSMLVTMPFVLLLLDYWPLKRSAECGVRSAELGKASGVRASSWRWLVLEKLPMMAMGMIAGALTFLAQKEGGALANPVALSFLERMGNALVSYVRYLAKLFWPVDLAVVYPVHPWPAWACSGAGLLLAAISFRAIVTMRRQPYFFTGWFWFLGTLVPVIGLIQLGIQAMADRYTYLPLIGIFIALIWGSAELTTGWERRGFALTAASALILLACVAVTSVQLRYWKNTLTLFTRALAVTGDNFIIHEGLGLALDERGNYDEAMAHYKLAHEEQPDSPVALYRMGLNHARHGDYATAVGFYQEAMRHGPDSSTVRFNLANALAALGKTDDAAAQYSQSLRLDPNSADVHNNLGTMLAHLGRLPEALAQFEEALRLKPDYPEAHDEMGGVLFKLGQAGLAQTHYETAVRLKPDFAHAQMKLGLILAQQGHLQEAVPHLLAARTLEPQNPVVYYNLGAAYEALGQFDEAARAFGEMVRLKPGDEEARKRLAQVEAALRPKPNDADKAVAK
ncbi:MAG: Tetratricopeptide 2 repeat protein [Pedosphaera sp.]|nr:Tetratricopeptide 2 repeat protein [Pedosphaera sp.]